MAPGPALGAVHAVTIDERPEPLVPAHVDLNGYEFMPLKGEMLRRSSFNRDASDAEFRAAINLWWSSWWERPAASLPNNELDLAKFAGCKTIRAWRAVRQMAMRKWMLCSDDRWYHPVLGDIAITAYASRVSHSIKGAKGAQKRRENNEMRKLSTAPANSPAASPSNRPTELSHSPTNSNRSKVNTPLPPSAFAPSSTPQHASHSTANAERVKAEARLAAEHATPPPTGSATELLRQAAAREREKANPGEQPSTAQATPAQ